LYMTSANLASYVEIVGNAPGTLPTNHRLYADTITRGWKYAVTTGGGPAFTTNVGVGITLSFVGSVLRLTFDQPFASVNDFAVIAMSVSAAGQIVNEIVRSSASVVDLAFFTHAGAAVDPSAAVVGVNIIVVGRLP
jgi:hypothetical protein